MGKQSPFCPGCEEAKRYALLTPPLPLTLIATSVQRLTADRAGQRFLVVGRPDHLERFLGLCQTVRDTQAHGFFGVIGFSNECFQTANMTIPQFDIGRLSGFEAFGVPT